MVARDPLRNIVLDPRPTVERNKDGNLVSKDDPQVNSTRDVEAAPSPKQGPDVSGYSSGHVKAKPGEVFHTVTEETSEQEPSDAGNSKKKG